MFRQSCGPIAAVVAGFAAATGVTAQATPTLTTVQGTLGADGQIIITGAGFGAAPNVILFDDFRAGAPGQVHASQAVVGSWNQTRGIIYGDPLLSNGQGMRVVGDPGQLTSVLIFPEAADEVFISYKGYVPDGYKFPSATAPQTLPTISAYKGAWLMDGSNGHSSGTKSDYVIVSWTGGSFYPVASNDAGGPSTFDRGTGANWQWGTPVQWSFWAKTNGTQVEGTDGLFQSTNGQQHFSRRYTDYKRWFTENHINHHWDRINFVGYVRSDVSLEEGHNFILDDIYVAIGPNAAARVEIGNAPTYAQSTRLTFVTTGGLGDHWSDTQITATIRLGSFSEADLQNAYLYVTNADGVVNEQGYALNLLAPEPGTMGLFGVGLIVLRRLRVRSPRV